MGFAQEGDSYGFVHLDYGVVWNLPMEPGIFLTMTRGESQTALVEAIVIQGRQGVLDFEGARE